MTNQIQKIILTVLIVFTLPVSVYGFGMEFRGNIGGSFVDPNRLNTFLRSNSTKEVYIYGHMGADVIVFPIATPIGIGARYDYFNVKVDAITKGSGHEAELTASKWSALLTARIDQPTFYGGLIFTYGLGHKSNLTLTSPTGKRIYDDNLVNTTYTIGFDSGIKIFNLRLGTEAGYQSYVIREVKGSSAGNSGISIDLNGFYGIIHLGVGF